MKKEIKRNNAAPKAHPQRKRQGSDTLSPLSCALKNSLLGFLWTLPICVLLIFISAFLAFKSPDPDSLVRPLSVASLMISFLTCGFISGKLNSRSTFLCSLISSGTFAIFIMLVSLFISAKSTDAFSSTQRTLIYVLAIVAAITGGFLSSIKRKVARKPKRR